MLQELSLSGYRSDEAQRPVPQEPPSRGHMRCTVDSDVEKQRGEQMSLGKRSTGGSHSPASGLDVATVPADL